MKTTKIYFLRDPNTYLIRYVGKSCDPYKRTFNEKSRYCHINDAKDLNNHTHKANWIRSLLNNNKLPVLCIIDEVPKDNWQWYEKQYIKLLKDIGCDLTNSTEGGDGGSGGAYFKGKKHSENSKKLIKESNKKSWSNESLRLKQSLKFSGSNNPMYNRKFSDESKKKMSNAAKIRLMNKNNHPMFGKHHTKETKIKIVTNRTYNLQKHNTTKKIYAYDLNNNEIKKWDCIKYCLEDLKINRYILKKYVKNKVFVNNLFYLNF